jgi:microcystin-dependent protein
MMNTKYFCLVLLATLAVNIAAYAQVGIGGTPKSGSVLDLTNSNDKYLILPVSNADPSLILADTASVIYYKGNIYMKTETGMKVFTPWKWDGDSTHAISSPVSSTVGIGIVSLNGAPYRLQVANASSDISLMGSNASILVGNNASSHLLIDNNEIMAKKDPTTADTLRLQEDDGVVTFRSSAHNAGNATALKTYGSIEATGNIKATNINATGKIQESGYELLPQGSIIMWSGSTIPNGWALCDGSTHLGMNGVNVTTPNLRSKFIVGADLTETIPNDGDFVYALNETGGKDTVVLTINQMPTHGHSINDPGHSHVLRLYDNAGTYGADDADNSGTRPSGGTESSVTNITINTTGGGSFHENRPPYYALAFIMKL